MKVKYSFILEKFLKYLIYKNYCDTTIKTYTYYVTEFLNKVNKSPAHITLRDIEEYLLNYNYSSTSKKNQIISSVKLFSDKTLGMKVWKIKCERPRKEKTLPEILSRKEVLQIISSIKNLKHKAIIATIYSCGLRISECINLVKYDIDSQRMLVRIKQGKGKKDRFVPIKQDLIDLLRDYYKQYRPKSYLFEGQKGGKYSAGSIRKILERTVKSTGITKKVYVHLLRHSYATHMLENGNSIKYIQDILGHKNQKTTDRYTQVRTDHLPHLNLMSITPQNCQELYA